MKKANNAAIRLSADAVQLIVALDSAGYKDGDALLASVANPTKQCPAIFRSFVGVALDQLLQCGFAEAKACGSTDKYAVLCVPALQREYRLTDAGLNWRLQNGVRFGSGNAIRPH